MSQTRPQYDAVIIGSGPNGLAAAITLAQAGKRVYVIEAAEWFGGGMHTAELTLPGFQHDLCSAIHPLAVASPFFRSIPLERYGLRWVYPDAPVAHPLDGGKAILGHRSPRQTARQFDGDRRSYLGSIGRLATEAMEITPDLLNAIHIPQHPIDFARFGLLGLQSASRFIETKFQTTEGRAYFAGLAGHAMLSLDATPSAAFGLILGLLVHSTGWPFPAGGASSLADALVAYGRDLGVEFQAEPQRVNALDEVPAARYYFFDTSPIELNRIAGDQLPSWYRRFLDHYEYGPGVCKVDYALSEPVPWLAPECIQAGTVHLGGTFEEIAASERTVAEGHLSERPYVMLAQHTVADPSRAPDDKHTLWTYAHVPNGSQADMSAQIERQIERFAPGFQDRVLAKHVTLAPQLAQINPNLVGGDISCGRVNVQQLFARPAPVPNPYQTPNPSILICSAATPPGGGVHGMAGFHAAQSVLRSSRPIRRFLGIPS